MNDKIGARFIDYQYRELFRLPPGEKLHLSFLDGREMDAEVQAIDEYHVYVSRIPFHVCEYAERCQDLGIVIRPRNPRAGDVYDTYEIFQLTQEPEGRYLFCGYTEAKDSLRAEDYTRVYAGMLPKQMDLNEIDALHNSDFRPLPTRIRSLSVSDIVVMTRDGKEKAFYVDNVGYRELLGFAEQLKRPQPHRNRPPERDER